MVGAVMSMQSAEMPPTAAQLQACTQQSAAYTALMAKWTALNCREFVVMMGSTERGYEEPATWPGTSQEKLAGSGAGTPEW